MSRIDDLVGQLQSIESELQVEFDKRREEFSFEGTPIVIRVRTRPH